VRVSTTPSAKDRQCPEAPARAQSLTQARAQAPKGSRTFRKPFAVAPFRVSNNSEEPVSPQTHAEVFYLQKQVQAQTPMVIVLEDGERVEGCIEWYDHNAIKVRGRTKTLIYKSSIKYMHKLGDPGQ
jgi:sRNA-binding regulator protein Hfq